MINRLTAQQAGEEGSGPITTSPLMGQSVYQSSEEDSGGDTHGLVRQLGAIAF